MNSTTRFLTSCAPLLVLEGSLGGVWTKFLKQ